ncbi:unnamed protein product [Adineta steineri]|uniref:Transcriptional coactivator p15 (PC4) C-terminal domain-containing protein n=1 Tax=Adineta steineri TaxID=433720 RepID=A0A813Q6Q7_9BILA|nr:unnamed protein product [Adineta steineri]CAF0790921.1 unnamed protein product [Adineta steineri]CAF3666015.1 unnamed protein product [Adineta steineri]CAF3710311.1 unnamed protein product [Adineta steineri]
MNDTLISRVLSTIQYNQFLAGLSGGVVSSVILHPFDLVKIRFQVTETKSLIQNSSLPYRPRYTSLFDAFRTIYREKGLLHGLYQGVTPNVLGNGMSWGLYLFLYNTIDVLNTNEYKRKNLTLKDRIIYSTIAGVITISITNPIWVIKTRMCLQYSDSKSNVYYKNMFDCIRKIYKLEGMKAFYKGLTPGIFGTIHGTIQFVSYEQMKDFYVKTFHTTQFSTPIILMFSALSKLVAASTTYPYQVVRTRLQDQHQQYNGVLDVIKRTYSREGISGFYKGMVPALFRVVPACCITFVVYEFVLKELKAMPKSKEFIDSDSASDQESGATSTSKKPKVKDTTSKNEPSAKRPKTSNEADSGIASKAGSNGERLYEFGKLRYVSVSEFRNKPYINIREYYEDKGIEKPGKKGISLTADQWDKLKTLVNQIDVDLKKFK